MVGPLQPAQLGRIAPRDVFGCFKIELQSSSKMGQANADQGEEFNPHFALQQSQKPLRKGQWYFSRLLCIGAAGIQH
jgi:hypothetical protein